VLFRSDARKTGYLGQDPLDCLLGEFAGDDMEGTRNVDTELELERWGAGDLVGRTVTRLSGGELVRVGLASCLPADAHLWIIDEPTAGMDGRSIRFFWHNISEHVAGGGAVVISSHELVAPGEGGIQEATIPDLIEWNIHDGRLVCRRHVKNGQRIGAIGIRTELKKSGKHVEERPALNENDPDRPSRAKNTNSSPAIRPEQSVRTDSTRTVVSSPPLGRWVTGTYWSFLLAIIGGIVLMAFIEPTKLRTISSNLALLLLFICVLFLGGIALHLWLRPLDTRMVVLIAIVAALAAALRIPFAALPNVQPSTVIVFLAGAALGPFPGAIVGITVPIVSNGVLGQGPWTLFQCVAWSLCGASGGVIRIIPRRFRGAIALVLVGLWGFLYGALLDTWTFVAFFPHELRFFLIVQATGLPFNAAHAIGNLAFMSFGGKRMYRSLERYGSRLRLVTIPRRITEVEKSGN
jgi:energy-coupling factor transport system substrate-specific component